MIKQLFNADFWRWYLRKEFDEFKNLNDSITLIEGIKNVFDTTKSHSVLSINLETEICKDSEGNEFNIIEFIAIKTNNERKFALIETEVDYERWLAIKIRENAAKEYERDFDNYQWVRKRGGEKVVVTEFDLILESIIEKWNPEKKNGNAPILASFATCEVAYLFINPSTLNPFKPIAWKNSQKAYGIKTYFR